MSFSDVDGPRPGGLVIVHGPLARVVELVSRDGVAGALVAANDTETAWVPLTWLLLVPLAGQDGQQ